ncbi:MAG: poly(beta-D-mannuronate) O-acetylase, partial [Gemmatimonadota bacterium]|nr:poly(beta-D-mannuronate) O-acetylase [Gemmatimonadota bacterium]
MLFNSWEFLVFFPVVVALYFATPFRFRWALLLAASYYFYA